MLAYTRAEADNYVLFPYRDIFVFILGHTYQTSELVAVNLLNFSVLPPTYSVIHCEKYALLLQDQIFAFLL